MFFQGFLGFIDVCSVGRFLEHRIPGKIQLEKCFTHWEHGFYPAPLPALSSSVAGRKSQEFPVCHKNLHTEDWGISSHSRCPEGHFQCGGSFQRNPCHSPSLENGGTGKEGKRSWRYPKIHGSSPASLRDPRWLCGGIWWPKDSQGFAWQRLLPTGLGNPEGWSGNVPSSFFPG